MNERLFQCHMSKMGKLEYYTVCKKQRMVLLRQIFCRLQYLCLPKLSLLSTNVPRNFVVGEWIQIIQFLARAGEWAGNKWRNPVENNFETIRHKLFILCHVTIFCGSVLNLSARPERDSSLAYI